MSASCQMLRLLAAQGAGTPDLLGGCSGTQVANLQNRYLEFRKTYADVRETAVTALDRLKVIDRLVPGFDIPQEPIDDDRPRAPAGARHEDHGRERAAITDGPVHKVAGVALPRRRPPSRKA